ncbi:4'-phosphopantetheinyl transferase family protein [Luteibacter rhizovicinus]|nr:4'-phosphopantetheinyl transferase superfamily protein [Luteibacter rhizovicinus]
MMPNRHPVPDEWRAFGVVDVQSVDLGWKQPSVPPAVLITYDVDAFDVEAFGRLGVATPASIGRSVTKRQAEFLMGRLAARAAIDGLVGRRGEHPSPMNRLQQGADGSSGSHARDAIGIGASRQPIWPAGVVGSISHAGRYAAAVVARSANEAGITGIGIDIEQRISAETRESVEGTVVTDAERSFLHGMDSELPYDMLLTIAFSAKESFFKGSFASVGTYFDFDAVNLVALDVATGSLELALTRTLAPTLPQGRRFTLRAQCIDADTILTSFVW